MKRFSEMNPLPIAAIGSVVAVLVLVAGVKASSLPVISGGTTYEAVFSEAGGLEPGDAVTVAGIEVGDVDEIVLDGRRVLVAFTVEDDSVRLGESTAAAIKVKTVLGQKFLELTSRGHGRLGEGDRIPLSRTTAPYKLTDVLGELTTTVDQIETEQLSDALETIANTFQDIPPELREALKGVSRISETINSRDAALRELLDHAASVTGVLSARRQQLTTLLTDGNLLLAELQRRREVIHELLINVSEMSAQLTGLVADNREQLEPALRRLNDVLEVLTDNAGNISVAISGLKSFAYALGESVASGPFFNAYIPNLIPGNLIGPQLRKELAKYVPQRGRLTGAAPGGRR